MWRVQGFAGRVLSRCYGNTPLRLSQSHHVEDELVNSSTLLSTSRHSDTSSQKGEDGERRKKRTSQFCFTELPRFTALDAVGWGAATVLFMHMCRRIHGQLSSGSEPSPNTAPPGGLEAAALHKCGYRILLEILSRRDVLPRGRGVLCLQGAPERQEQTPSQASSSSSSSSGGDISLISSELDRLIADSSSSDHQRAAVSQHSHAPGSASPAARLVNLLEALRDEELKVFQAHLESKVLDGFAPIPSVRLENADRADTLDLMVQTYTPGGALKITEEILRRTRRDLLENLTTEEALDSSPAGRVETHSRANTEDKEPSVPEEDRLAGAAGNLRHVADSSVPVILNIIGLESAKSGDFQAAFSCFLASAQHGYSKAQFNTGVCYETGRGTHTDTDKAALFYRQAAAGGHSQAQYRCARLLLSSRGQQSPEELHTAIRLLEQASAGGVTEAQVYLGSVYSQEPVKDGCKSVHYLKMAAESGDHRAKLLLGQCYERGFGVRQDRRRAVGLYKEAAQAGNSHAQSLLTPPCGAEDGTLRSIRSAPCFSASHGLSQPPLAGPAPGHAPEHAPGPAPSNDRPSWLPPPLPSSLTHSWSTGTLGSSCSSLPLSYTALHLHSRAPGAAGGPCRWTLG